MNLATAHPLDVLIIFGLFVVIYLLLAYRDHLRETRKMRRMVLKIMAERGDTTPPEEVSVEIKGVLLTSIFEAGTMAFTALGMLTLGSAILRLI